MSWRRALHPGSVWAVVDSDPDVVVRSRYISPHWFALLRLASFAYVLGINIAYIDIYPRSDGYSIAFFTNQNYLLLTAYLGVAAFLSLRAWRRVSVASAVNSGVVPLKDAVDSYAGEREVQRVPQKPQHARRFVWVAFQMLSANVVFLDVVFWTLLFHGDADFDDVNRHAINFAFLLFEITFNCLPVVLEHMGITVAYLASYLVFAWTYHGVSGTWIYPFLNYERTAAAWQYPVLCVFYIAIYMGHVKLSEWRVGKLNIETGDDARREYSHDRV